MRNRRLEDEEVQDAGVPATAPFAVVLPKLVGVALLVAVATVEGDSVGQTPTSDVAEMATLVR